MGLLTRILARYLIGALAGILIYSGLPKDIVDMARNDPEIMTAMIALIGAGIEGGTVLARRRGWFT